MDTAFMTYKEVVDEYKLQITKKDARIRELENEIKQAYYEGWGDAIRETGEEFFNIDMENNWLESDAIKATEALKEGEDETI